MKQSKMIKIFAIDLDGTLYDENKNISDLSRKMINKAIHAGIQPILATGRGSEGAELALDLLQMDLPFICSAGALIKSGRDGDVIYENSFHHSEDLFRMLRFARETNSAVLGEPVSGGILFFGSDESLDMMDEQTKREIKKGTRSFDPEVDFNIPLLKFTLVAFKPVMDQFREMVQKECSPYNIVESGVQFLDLTAANTNKGTALEYYTKFSGFESSQTASIGDQEIDVHMLRYSGIRFAMANAVDQVKRIAHIVVPSNNEHGVVRAIEHILENNDAACVQ